MFTRKAAATLLISSALVWGVVGGAPAALAGGDQPHSTASQPIALTQGVNKWRQALDVLTPATVASPVPTFLPQVIERFAREEKFSDPLARECQFFPKEDSQAVATFMQKYNTAAKELPGAIAEKNTPQVEKILRGLQKLMMQEGEELKRKILPYDVNTAFTWIRRCLSPEAQEEIMKSLG